MAKWRICVDLDSAREEADDLESRTIDFTIYGGTGMVNVRQATDKILEMVEEGILDKDMVIMSCLKYMSEDDVADMAHCNEFFLEEEVE